MSKQYQVSEDVILQIIKMSYESGCNGYMDLKDNISQELLVECVKMCKPLVEYVGNNTLTVQANYNDGRTSITSNNGNYVDNQFNFYSNV